MCLGVFAPMIETMSVRKDKMYAAAGEGFINATDLADYLVKKGRPFRSAYKTVGQIVADCIDKKCTLESYPLESYKAFDELFENDLYADIDLRTCAEKRTSEGGTSVSSVEKQLEFIKKYI